MHGSFNLWNDSYSFYHVRWQNQRLFTLQTINCNCNGTVRSALSYKAPPCRLTKAETESDSEAHTLLCIQTTSFCKTSIFIIPNGLEQNKAIGKQASLEPQRLSWALLCAAVLNLKFIPCWSRLSLSCFFSPTCKHKITQPHQTAAKPCFCLKKKKMLLQLPAGHTEDLQL